MRRIGLALLVASSLLFAASATRAATRPHYGSTLHVMIRGAPMSLDPVDQFCFDAMMRKVLSVSHDELKRREEEYQEERKAKRKAMKPSAAASKRRDKPQR